MCKCDCGNEQRVDINNLIHGKSEKCIKCRDKEVGRILKEREFKEGTKLSGLTQKVRSDSSTGAKGIYVNHRNGKYVAEIKLKGKKYWLGEFSNIEDAIKRRATAEAILFDPILEKYNRETTVEKRRKENEYVSPVKGRRN